jgi:hypothetical protein
MTRISAVFGAIATTAVMTVSSPAPSMAQVTNTHFTTSDHSLIENVYWRGRHWHRGWGGGAGVAAGIAAGALIGGALAYPHYYHRHYYYPYGGYYRSYPYGGYGYDYDY